MFFSSRLTFISSVASCLDTEVISSCFREPCPTPAGEKSCQYADANNKQEHLYLTKSQQKKWNRRSKVSGSKRAGKLPAETETSSSSRVFEKQHLKSTKFKHNKRKICTTFSHAGLYIYHVFLFMVIL